MGPPLHLHLFTIFTVTVQNKPRPERPSAGGNDEVQWHFCDYICVPGWQKAEHLPPLVPVHEEVKKRSFSSHNTSARSINRSCDNQRWRQRILCLSILGPFLLSPPPLSPWPSPCLSGAGARRKGVWGWVWGACVRRGWTAAGGPWTCVRPGRQSWRGRSYRVSFWGIPRRRRCTACSFWICWTFCGSASVFPPSSWSAAGSPVQRAARVNIFLIQTWWSDWSKVILNVFTCFSWSSSNSKLWPPSRTQSADQDSDLRCAVYSRGRKRCTRGPRWHYAATEWWWWSDSWHSRCPLAWRPTVESRRGG